MIFMHSYVTRVLLGAKRYRILLYFQLTGTSDHSMSASGSKTLGNIRKFWGAAASRADRSCVRERV